MMLGDGRDGGKAGRGRRDRDGQSQKARTQLIYRQVLGPELGPPFWASLSPSWQWGDYIRQCLKPMPPLPLCV